MLTALTNKNYKYTLLSSISVFIFVTWHFIYKGAYNIGFLLLIFNGAIHIFDKETYKINKQTKNLIIIFLLYFLVFLASRQIDGTNIRVLDRPSRFLLGIVILLGLLRYPPQKKFFFFGIGLGSISAALISIYGTFILHDPRGFANQMPIIVGDTSILFGLCSLCIGFYYYTKTCTIQASFFFIASICGLIASILSGSRGGWIFTPFIFLSIIYIYRTHITKKIILNTFIIFFVISSVLIVVPHSSLRERIKATISETHLSLTQNKNKTVLDKIMKKSISMRFEFWSSAWLSFKEKPIFGWGNDGIAESRKIQYAQGKMNESLYQFYKNYDFKYPIENLYLFELATHGLIGLIILLLLLFIPSYYFYKNIKNPVNASQLCFAICGLITTFSIAGFGTSQIYISHNQGAVVMVSFLTIIYSLIEKEKQKTI